MRGLKIVVVILFPFIYSTNIIAQKSAEDILRKTVLVLKKYQSISYGVDFKFKFFSETDTLNLKANCILARDVKDSIMKGKIRVSFSDGYRKTIYDGSTIYQFNRQPENMFVLITYPHKEITNPLKRSNDYDVIDRNFLNPESLLKLIDKQKKITFEGTAVINKEECFVIRVDIPDNEDFKNQFKILCISKKTFYPIKIVHRVEDKDNFQYSEQNYSQIRFNNATRKDFNAANLQQGLRVILTADLQKQFNKAPLASNTYIPDFDGIIYPSLKAAKLSDYYGKLVLIDFWYMACGPCVKAIPALDSLYRKYNNNGLVVIGINSVDNTEKQKAKLPRFKLNNSISYSIMMVDKKVDELFHIDTYPSLYLINTKGKILFFHRGFDGALPVELITMIEDEINQQ